MPSIDEALEFMRTNDIRWVDLQFIDLNGQLQHRTIAARNFSESAFSNGIETDLSPIYGHDGKALLLMPDQDSYSRIPWEPNSMRIICNVYTTNKERYLKDPRYSIERVNINAKAIGITDVQLATETEFYVFDNVTGDKLAPERGPNFLIDTREAYWNPSPFWSNKSGAFIAPPHDTLYAMRVQIAELMEDHFRFGVDDHSHGRSPNGQQKFKLGVANAKLAADAFTTLKYVVKNLAFIANSIATFMPLPIMNDKGSSLSIIQKLTRNAINIFSDPKGDYGLSSNALYYIGGILEHAEALSIFTMPTTNSYKKARNDPRYVCWSTSNPNSLVHVPFSASEENKVISYTAADPSINPYLAYAAVVAAGLDGIKNKLDPGKPVEENIESMDAKRMRELKIRQLPSNLMDAIAALESDNKFLKGFISAELLAEYLEQRVAEYRENERMTTAYEIETYFNR